MLFLLSLHWAIFLPPGGQLWPGARALPRHTSSTIARKQRCSIPITHSSKPGLVDSGRINNDCKTASPRSPPPPRNSFSSGSLGAMWEKRSGERAPKPAVGTSQPSLTEDFYQPTPPSLAETQTTQLNRERQKSKAGSGKLGSGTKPSTIQNLPLTTSTGTNNPQSTLKTPATLNSMCEETTAQAQCDLSGGSRLSRKRTSPAVV